MPAKAILMRTSFGPRSRRSICTFSNGALAAGVAYAVTVRILPVYPASHLAHQGGRVRLSTCPPTIPAHRSDQGQVPRGARAQAREAAREQRRDAERLQGARRARPGRRQAHVPPQEWRLASRTRAAAHVARFNAAVESGDWDEFVASFADDAVLEFVNVPAGPYRGRSEIAAAYRDNPPDDTIAVRSVRSSGQRDEVSFEWSRGGAGLLQPAVDDDGPAGSHGDRIPLAPLGECRTPGRIRTDTWTL